MNWKRHNQIVDAMNRNYEYMLNLRMNLENAPCPVCGGKSNMLDNGDLLLCDNCVKIKPIETEKTRKKAQ